MAVFQWGWAKGLFGLDETVPIVAFVPMMMFAILFGLSMDYEVFLLSRIREEYARTGDNTESVARGLAVAIALDATVVRMVLVPAAMALLGKANWWLPAWLDRILPHVSVESAEDEPASTPELAVLAAR